MFSTKTKQMIAREIQKILMNIQHNELPKNNINFILHVDGAEFGSWANIRNNEYTGNDRIPSEFIKNRIIE